MLAWAVPTAQKRTAQVPQTFSDLWIVTFDILGNMESDSSPKYVSKGFATIGENWEPNI